MALLWILLDHMSSEQFHSLWTFPPWGWPTIPCKSRRYCKINPHATMERYLMTYHRLRGSASPVLTATGFVNGKWQFSTPQNRHPSTDHQTICHRWLCRRPLRLCQTRCISVHGRLLSTWVKYNQNYFYLCPFWGNHLQVRPVDGFLRMMAQTTRTQAKMCHLGQIFYIVPHLGVKTPKTPILGRE